MTFIKQDPEMQQQEEQEDLIMSYLNADYLSTDSTPLSPPSSTSSSSETTGSPEKHNVDDFMLDINSTTDFLVGNDHWSTTNNLFNPCFPQQQQQQSIDYLVGNFPFFLQTTNDTTTPNNFIQPFTQIIPSSSSSTGSLSDSEQPKKKRGRKKRETIIQNLSPVQPSLLAPKPLAPRPNIDVVIKTEPNVMESPQHVLVDPSEASSSSSSPPPPPPPPSQEAQKAAQIQKRQERLIKNRAAALLSRKRKREHLTCLEEEKQILVLENEKLSEKVFNLETRIQSLEKENLDLKQHLQLTTNPTCFTVNHHQHQKRQTTANNANKSSKATGVVFMIILFSFALFTLPSRTADRLTVGGTDHTTSDSFNKKQFPLIGSSDYSMEQYCQTNDCAPPTTTDLVLIDTVQPRDLQTWINHSLDDTSAAAIASNELQTWNNKGQETTKPRHVYLYSKEFSQIAPMHPSQHEFNTDLPILSLVSPYNSTETNKTYLQIDVQVLRSTVIQSQLLPLQQCDSASTLLGGLKNDLLVMNPSPTANVTPSIIVKREKRAIKKLARVIY